MKKNSNIVLASSSKYRQELLGKLGIPFVCFSPGINEDQLPGESAEQLIRRLSIEKAVAASSRFTDHLIIGSDQVATTETGELLTKPHTFKNAAAQLGKLSGKIATFHTGLTLYNSKTNRAQTITDVTTVAFKHLSSAQIDAYITRDNPLDCAGSFKSESLGICLFDRIEGRDPNALVGLPLIALTELLQNEGVDPLIW